MNDRQYPAFWCDRADMTALRRDVQKPWVKEEFWSFYVMRPVSLYISVFLVKRTKVSPNLLTGLAMLFALLAALGYLWGSWLSIVAGFCLFQISYLLDCMDGEVARLTRRMSPLGVWLDSGLHYLYYLAFVAAVYGVLQSLGDVWQTVAVFLAVFGVFLDLFVSEGFEAAFQGNGQGKTTESIRKKSRWSDGLVFLFFSFYGFHLGLLVGALVWRFSGSPVVLGGWGVYALGMTIGKGSYKLWLHRRALM